MAAKETKTTTCRCAVPCKIVVTIKDELDELCEIDEKAERWIHCHVCRQRVEIDNDIEDEGDYIMCITCKRESPICACGAKGVEPTLSGAWGDKCVDCCETFHP